MDKVTNWFLLESIRKAKGGQEERGKNGVLEHWSDGVLERGEDTRLSNLRPAACGTAEDGHQGFRLRSHTHFGGQDGVARKTESREKEEWSTGALE